MISTKKDSYYSSHTVLAQTKIDCRKMVARCRKMVAKESSVFADLHVTYLVSRLQLLHQKHPFIAWRPVSGECFVVVVVVVVTKWLQALM